ncbi:hypothetical protein PO909_029844 [Leuciscus waleckii]
MTTGEDTEPTLWPDRAQATLTTAAQLEEAEDLPAGLTGSVHCLLEVAKHLGSPLSNVQLPYPTLAPVVFFWLHQSTRLRSWCLALVCSPYPFFVHTFAYSPFRMVY